MPYTKIALFAGAIVVVVVALLGIAYFAQISTSETEEQETTITGPGYTIEQEALTEIPDLSRTVVFGASVPEEARAAIQAKVDGDVAVLTIDKTNAGAWLDLGLQYKMANDLEGARLVWEFLVRAAPTETTPLDNLGRMYHFDLKQYAKAEEYFKKSIAVNPKSVAAYIELFDLYRYSYKQNTTAAVDIMHAAAAQFPTDAGIPFALGQYYRDLRQSAAARAEYAKALGIARTAGNIELVGAINAELANLP